MWESLFQAMGMVLLLGIISWTAFVSVSWFRRRELFRTQKRQIESLTDENERLGRENQRLTQENASLGSAVLTDGLTSLYNRAGVNKRLLSAISHALRKGEGLTALFLDLNGFKQVNDAFGHQTGDELLSIIGRTLGRAIGRPADVVGRLGGDEFLVCLVDTDISRAFQAARRISDQMRNIVLYRDDREIRTSFSIGVAELRVKDGMAHVGGKTWDLSTCRISPIDAEVASYLVETADSAAYVAKDVAHKDPERLTNVIAHADEAMAL